MTTTTTRRLTFAEMELLEFERATWSRAGHKTDAIRTRFGITTTRYTQRLLAVLALPAAAEYDPQLVGRLTRLRDRRTQARHGGFTSLDHEAGTR